MGDGDHLVCPSQGPCEDLMTLKILQVLHGRGPEPRRHPEPPPPKGPPWPPLFLFYETLWDCVGLRRKHSTRPGLLLVGIPIPTKGLLALRLLLSEGSAATLGEVNNKRFEED